MQNVRLLSIACLSLLCLTSCHGLKNSEPSLAEIEQGFRDIPDSVQTAVYWYWISNNISKEGVVKDLHAMKKVGINKAFLGSMGVDGVPYGDVKFLSPEWWDITHTALKTASELGIEIGIFNSPGWSQSGGPWVKPEEAMRYLSSTPILVKGNGEEQQIRLPDMGENAQLVYVLAYPTPEGKKFDYILDKKEGKELVKDISIEEGSIIRSISVSVKSRIKTSLELSIDEGDGNGYKPLKTVDIDRSNPALHVGFDPFAPIVISIPEKKIVSYRFKFNSPGSGEITLSLSEIPLVERYPEKSLAKMFQTPLPMWHEYMWDRQPEVSNGGSVVNPDNVLNLTDRLENKKTLSWQVPDGNWTILCTAMRPTGVVNSPAVPEATGLEIDKMSKKHIKTHFDAYIGEILRRIPADDRKSFRVVVQDSYETGGLNWTDDMAESFRQKYNYDPTPYIPALFGTVVGNRDISDRFLWDLRRLIADRVAYDYVGGLREICHQHGLQTWLENYGHWGFPGEFLMYGGQSDQISGEFWSEGSLGDIENKAASSCGHIYGKRKIWAESCTSGGPVFSRYPNIMKQRIDRFFTEGINSTLLHLYIQQPDDRQPGLDAWFGNEFNRNNTWFEQLDVFVDYLKRCNFLLQQGRYIADVAYFIGEDAPKMTGVCDPALPVGYSYDYINAEVLMNHADVKDKKLVLDSGMEYSLLVLPKQETMRPELLEKIKNFVADGLTIVGPAPLYSPSLSGYPDCDERVRKIGRELWGTSQDKVSYYGKGSVYKEGVSIEDIVSAQNLKPDFLADNDAQILYIHRQLPDGEIYFLSNQDNKAVKFQASFRVTDTSPELWNPQTGEIRVLTNFEQKDEHTVIPMELHGWESAFVIFRKGAQTPSTKLPNFPDKRNSIKINAPWNLTFMDERQRPESAVVMNELQDLSKSDNDTIRYYSGSVKYSTTITIDRLEREEYYLDLGKVMVMGKVWINGTYAGGVWTDPYRLNITEQLKTGENTIEIVVVNNWMNRLIGDSRLPEKERMTWTNINPWKPDSPLQSSGLLGPVEIYSYQYNNK